MSANTARVLSSRSGLRRRKAAEAIGLKEEIDLATARLNDLRRYFINEANGETLTLVVEGAGRVTVSARTTGKVEGIEETVVVKDAAYFRNLPPEQQEMLIQTGFVTIEKRPRVVGGAEPSFRVTLND